jgi:protein-tyrosine phosphatase
MVQAMKPKNILFLCTGNYYRSRFAELLFNHLAQQHDLKWQATSRGLALELGVNNVGSISQHTLAGLAARAIALEVQTRYPLALNESDLEDAHHIVAVNRDEHLPILERKFPLCVKQVEFWHVRDLDFAMPEEALAQLERNVRGLIYHLCDSIRGLEVNRFVHVLLRPGCREVADEIG